ncbi:hypothetical protein [Victivallis sp. Marseille-Q1083]|uniref:hypothetical protein n=1 Tax=Victivallis sp. Marseille-Q1083 TaxID=2717288 RepID=UPI00158B6DE6|nr:hypothetical protein [Victivallis sp. Marseille-Q1083]
MPVILLECAAKMGCGIEFTQKKRHSGATGKFCGIGTDAEWNPHLQYSTAGGAGLKYVTKKAWLCQWMPEHNTCFAVVDGQKRQPGHRHFETGID